jgi:ligand-binding sensor domain-containing protein
MRIATIIFLFLSFASNAQRYFSRDFWLNETQAPVNVNAIAQSPSGYMWVGTDNGLYRFNGREFHPVKDTGTKAITALASVDNTLYIGYSDGSLAKLTNGQIIQVKASGSVPCSTIRDIYSDGKGLLWLATEEGVFLLSNGRYVSIDNAAGLSDNFTYQLSPARSSMLVGTDNGISRLELMKGRPVIQRYGTQQGLPDNIVNVVRACPGQQCIWTGTNEGGLARLKFEGNTISELIKYAGDWSWGQVSDIIAVSGTEAWASTETGYLLHVQVNGGLHIEPYFFGDKKFRKLLLVRSGNLWCATNNGLTIITIAHAAYTIARAPYFFSTLTAIAGEGNSKLWLGQEKELLSMPLNKDTVLPQRLAQLPAAITCLQVQDSNTVWIGTFGAGLWRYHNRQLQRVTEMQGVDNGNILSIALYEGHLWVASLNGVDEMDVSGDRVELLRHHNKLSGIGSDYVYHLYNDGRGRLWLATDGAGVAMYDGEAYHRWTAQQGMTAKVVYSLVADATGHIWAGTPGDGVFSYDGKAWKQYTVENGLQDMNISSVVANGSGQVIVVSQKGIDEWFPASNLFRRFNKKTAINIEYTSTVLNCAAKDNAGNAYVPFDNGFVVFTKVKEDIDLRPDISINEMDLFLKPVSGTEFNYNENQVSFQYEGITFSNMDRLHYRYKLDGYHNDWIYTTDENITFSQLPPGKFTFRIQVSLDKDFSNANEASRSFSIRSPYWKSPWFLALVILAVFGLLFLYIRLRERGLKKLNRLQSERMRFEYEHLKSQVNPHFLFNSLNTLSALIEEDKGKAADYTSQLSDLYRSMLSHKDMDLISLADELEIIENYMYIQQTRFGDALKLELDISEEIRKNRKIIPLALQILVENAIKHNIVSRSMPLVINIEADNEAIRVKNALHPKITKEKGQGLGLSNIQRRYSLLTKKHIHYGISNDQFIVSLPLL